MFRKLQSLCTAGAFVIGAGLPVAMAQTSITSPSTTPSQSTTVPSDPSRPATQPGTQPSSTDMAGSPSTPPTHPTLRNNPAGLPQPNTSGSVAAAPSKELEEAKQVCKNLTGPQERMDCIKKAEEDEARRQSSGSTSTSGTSGVTPPSTSPGTSPPSSTSTSPGSSTSPSSSTYSTPPSTGGSTQQPSTSR